MNVRGVIDSVSGERYVIKLSEKSQSFLKTKTIEINPIMASIQLEIKDDVFIKFNDISINGDKLIFKSIEIYKYVQNIEKENLKEETWYVFLDFDGVLKCCGEGFTYNNERYVEEYDNHYGDGKIYFVDIYDGNLLIEEYKNLFWPKKWFNMINPQETYFDEILKFYSKIPL